MSQNGVYVDLNILKGEKRFKKQEAAVQKLVI